MIENGHGELVRNALVSQVIYKKRHSNDKALSRTACIVKPSALHLIISSSNHKQRKNAITWENWEVGCIEEAINSPSHAVLDLIINRHQALSLLATIVKTDPLSGGTQKQIRVDTLTGRRSFTIHDEDYWRQINERIGFALMSEADGHFLYLTVSTKEDVMIKILVVQVGVSWASSRPDFSSIGPELI